MKSITRRFFLLRFLILGFFSGLLKGLSPAIAQGGDFESGFCSFNMKVKFPYKNKKYKDLMSRIYDFERENRLVQHYKKNSAILSEKRWTLNEHHFWTLLFKNKAIHDRFLKENEENYKQEHFLTTEKWQKPNKKRIFFSGKGYFHPLALGKNLTVEVQYFSRLENRSIG